MILSIQREKEMHVILEKLEKAVQNENQKSAEKKKTSEKTEEHKPTHNSLQHEPSVSVPLLSLLVEALRKDNKNDDEKEGLEIIAEEAVEEDATDEKKRAKKDAIVALAERIKNIYANELKEQMYGKALQANYNANDMQYKDEISSQMQKAMKHAYIQDGDETEKRQKIKAIDDENSAGYKMSKGSRYQAFVMTDPKGRWHSTWEITRIISETYDGKIERNDGLHYQGLS